MCKKIHLLRYNCKFNLQICAILSQVGKHIEAFKFGELGVHFCRLLIQETVTLLNSHISNIKKEQTQLLSQRQDNKIKDQKKIQQEYNIDAKKRGRKRKRSKSSRSARDSQNSSVSS